MAELVCELIVSIDGFAQGKRSPAYFGYFGPDFADWIKTNMSVPHRTLMGRRTYEALAGLPPEVWDEGYEAMRRAPGWVFSHTLKRTEWPGLKVVRENLVAFVRELKDADGPELRTLGSLSLVRQLLTAALVDRLTLVICPLILPQTGVGSVFEGLSDTGFELVSTKVLDTRILLLNYRPTGEPPRHA